MNNMSRRCRFTMIEVLVTMVIMALLAGLIVGAFHAGLMGYQRLNEQERGQLAVAGALAIMTADARRFVPVPGAEKFDVQAMAFNIATDKPEYRLERVAYRLNGDRLERTVEDYRAAAETGIRPPPTVVMGNVARLNFDYRKYYIPVPGEKDKNKDQDKSDDNKGLKRNVDDAVKTPEPQWPEELIMRGELTDGRQFTASIRFPVFMGPVLTPPDKTAEPSREK